VTDSPSAAAPTDEALDGFYTALLDDDPSALYERAPCGYLSTTPEGSVIKVNQTLCALTGYAKEELVGRRTFRDLLTAGGRIYYETHLAPMLQMHGQVRATALDIVRADGERLPVLVNAVLERDAEGDPAIVRTALFDATDRREYERELLRAKQRAEESEVRARALAHTLQQTLIPPAPPEIPELDMAAAFRPAGSGDEIGGDFYDIFEVSAGDWAVAIGDVCGKGVEAAVVTALARHTIRAAAVNSSRPSEILKVVNEVLLRHDSDRFCTIALMRLRRTDDAWVAEMGCAGHPLPLVWNQAGEPRAVGEPGTLLGVLPRAKVVDARLVLRSGDAIVLYTDGVTEARAGAELFGEERLRAALPSLADSAAAVADGVLDEVMRFQSGFPSDDIALVALRIP
jgi:sigma-B regulation protein RsbU (phosphoserine phosphatase)